MGKDGRDKDVSFYRLPKITASKGSRVLELSKKRRAGYIAAISRGDLTKKFWQMTESVPGISSMENQLL